MNIVGGIGKSILKPARYLEIGAIALGQIKRKNLGGLREIWGAEGIDFPMPPEFLWRTDIFSSLIHPWGWIRKSIPLDQSILAVLKSILPC